MEDGTQLIIVETVIAEILVGELAKRSNGCDVLGQAADLAVADGDRLDALFQRQQAFDNRHRVGHKRRDQGSGQRAERFAVNADTVFFIQAHQAVAVLPVANRLFQGDALGIGNVVGDTAAFVAGKAAGHGDFRQQTRVRRTVAYLDRFFQRFSHPPAGRDAVVNHRQTV